MGRIATIVLGICPALIFTGCQVAEPSAVSPEFATSAPKTIAVFIDAKPIHERPAGFVPFTPSSFFPDVNDEGSILAFRANTVPAAFLSDADVFDIFRDALQHKGYVLTDLSSKIGGTPEPIDTMIAAVGHDKTDTYDAVLFVDYSCMLNANLAQSFKAPGIEECPGHAIYLRYGLFDATTGRFLVRHSGSVHPYRYDKSEYTDVQVIADVSRALTRHLESSFPSSPR